MRKERVGDERGDGEEKRETRGFPALYLTPGYRPASQLHFRHCWRYMQACRPSGAGTRWNAVPANILEPERRSGKYRWPQVERQH